MLFKKNDKVLCKIIDYKPQERIFEVEDVCTHKKGKVVFLKHYHDIPLMKSAYQKHENVTLYFDKFEDGILYFKYRIYETQEPVLTLQETDKCSLSSLFSLTDSDFNKSLFDALYSALKECIDSEEKYSLAKQLLILNKKAKFKANLTKELFRISNSTYQMKFWDEGIIPYFSNIGIKKLWSTSDNEKQRDILQKLGIESATSTTEVNCYFENIEDIVIQHIESAKSSILACIAWFTNFTIYKAIKSKLNEGIRVVLLTNNDLINNGGYCLNFNELINAGLELHLAEYPSLIHHKFCIIDEAVVITGSYNWTFFSENVNRENIIIVKDNISTINAYKEEFNYLLNSYDSVTEMPESVPEKPEYDRSSFKQYISDELILRCKKNIGNTEKNIRQAISLSPTYISVIKAKSEFNIIEDNTNVSVSQLDTNATSIAISQRKEKLQELSQRKKELEERSATIVAETDGNVESHQNNVEEVATIQQEYTAITQDINQTQTEISAIQETAKIETTGGRGSLKINLKWNTFDDLDLHVIDPSDFEIYYGEKEHLCQGVLGKLDVDANAGSSHTKTPQENIFWEEGKDAPLGRYKVKVNFFAKKDTMDDIPYTVTVYPNKGETKIFTGIMRTPKDTQCVIEFDYNEDGISYLQ